MFNKDIFTIYLYIIIVHSCFQRDGIAVSDYHSPSKTGIDEAMIERLVRRFYEKIRADELLEPIFASRIDTWEPHLQRMFAFWSSVTLMTGRYSGNPMQKHIALPIDADHFDRWLEIFAETAAEICPPAAARLFVEKASRIAQSLELGIAQRHCQLINREQRFYRPKTPS